MTNRVHAGSPGPPQDEGKGGGEGCRKEALIGRHYALGSWLGVLSTVRERGRRKVSAVSRAGGVRA